MNKWIDVIPAKRPWILWFIGIKEEYRRQSLGSKLMQAVLDGADQDNLVCVTGMFDLESTKFFRQFGFKGSQENKPFFHIMMLRYPHDLRSNSSSSMSLIGIDKISGIEIKQTLGEGKFGQVYLGIWEGTEVALKKLKTTEDEQEFTQ